MSRVHGSRLDGPALGCALALAILACAAPNAGAQSVAIDEAAHTQRSPSAESVAPPADRALGAVSNASIGAQEIAAPTLALEESAPRAEHASRFSSVFTAERAQMLLRSLTIPGWGQLTVGRKNSALIFGLAETGIWGSFTAFRIQSQLRRVASEHTALLLAGIDVSDRDENFRRAVGNYISSDQYNQLVVYRDAANLYLSDPNHSDPQKYREYIAAHELKGDDAWQWQDVQSLLRYRGQRKDAHRASLHANGALGLAIVNRLISAFHAARVAESHPRAQQTGRSWRFEAVPADPGDPTAFRIGVRAGF